MVLSEGLTARGVYRVHSRNLVVAVYDGGMGFIGIREKSGHRSLFTEYAWEQGPPYGAVHEGGREFLAMLAKGIPVTEDLGTACTQCGQACRRIALSGWECGNGCAGVTPRTVPNVALFEALDAFTPEEERQDAERQRKARERRRHAR